MRVLSGRLKAVFVATLATVILLGGIVPAATTRAGDPPEPGPVHVGPRQDRVRRRLLRPQRLSGAYGKYQIMPSSWRAWAGRYLGDPNAKPTPANQDKVAAAKLRSLHAGLGTWRRTAYWWLTARAGRAAGRHTRRDTSAA